MGDIKNVIFNPETGLFEDSTNPTAHMTEHEVRQEERRARRRQRQDDPLRAQMKPVIQAISRTGAEHPLEGTTIELAWLVQNAQRVVITFPSGNKVNFPTAGRCQFKVPDHDFQVRLVAYNGRYTTQRTLSISPRRLTLFRRLLNRLL